jgi:hypothetical protein
LEGEREKHSAKVRVELHLFLFPTPQKPTKMQQRFLLSHFFPFFSSLKSPRAS